MDKWRSFNFAAEEVDGHNVTALKDVFSNLPLVAGKPNAVLCHTIKGKGIRHIESDPSWHHKSKLSVEEISKLFNALEMD